MTTPAPRWRIAHVPATPLLIPQVAAGAAGDLEQVRAHALRRVAWAAEDTGAVIVVAAAPGMTGVVARDVPDPLDLRGLGVAGTGETTDADALPPAISAAGWLTAQVGARVQGWWAVSADPDGIDLPAPLLADVAQTRGIVVVADGSCTRSAKAPGSYVEAAVDFDDRLVTALRAVDTAFLADPARTRDALEFGAQGLGAWALAARLVEALDGTWVGQLDIVDDPYGVLYVVGAWEGRE